MELVTIILGWILTVSFLIFGAFLFLGARLSYITNQTEIKNMIDGCIPETIKVEIKKRQRALNKATYMIVVAIIVSVTGFSMGVGVVLS